jgi:hypothetical protein
MKMDKLDLGKGRGGLEHHDILQRGCCHKLGCDCSEVFHVHGQRHALQKCSLCFCFHALLVLHEAE